MNRLGLKIATYDSNDEDDNASPLISSPMGKYYSEELRMTTKPLIKHPFDKVVKTIDIINILNSGEIINNIGKGARSSGQLIRLPDDKQYILRKTLVNNKKVRDDLINEQFIYTILESDPNYTKYVSNLLYADIPLIYHKSDAYNYAYFIFAYQKGETLDKYIDINKNKLSYAEIMSLISNITKSLEFISSKGIVHRDIKPENIFIDESRDKDTLFALLFDFDISCRIGVDCKASEFVGTRKYMTNGSKVILNVGNKFSAAKYEYNRFYDLYSLAVLIEEDLVDLVKSSDKDKLITYASMMKGQLKMYGGNRMRYNKTRKGGNKTGVLNPRFGGSKAKPQSTLNTLLSLSEITSGGGCPCAAKPIMALPPGASLGPLTAGLMKGGACGCQIAPKIPTPLGGGYRATKRNLKYLKKWKRGESIGFTMRSSLKAKGLIPRANGKKRVSRKYKSY